MVHNLAKAYRNALTPRPSTPNDFRLIFITMLWCIPSLKPLDYISLPRAQRVSHRFLSLLRYFFSSRCLVFSRACLSCYQVTCVLSQKKENNRLGQRKSRICFSAVCRAFFRYWFHRLLEIPFALEVFFFILYLSCSVRACTRRTAPRARPAPSRVSADGGGWRGSCTERGRRLRG